MLRAFKPHELRRTTTDIEQHNTGRMGINQWGTAGRGQARLGLAIYHFELKTKFV